MLTPQDIQDVKFVRSMKGYDKGQVEDFLDAVYSDYSALYKENATLKGKMRVLVDKIEEYRSVDEQMRKAFYTAQVTAQETISKAQAEADRILRDAHTEAENSVNDIRMQKAAEERRLEQAKSECRRYADAIKSLLEKNIGFMDTLMAKSASEIAPEAVKVEEEKKPSFEVDFDQIKSKAEAKPQENSHDDDDTIEINKPSAEPAAAAAAASADDSTRFNFSDLRFGKDYKEED